MGNNGKKVVSGGNWELDGFIVHRLDGWMDLLG